MQSTSQSKQSSQPPPPLTFLRIWPRIWPRRVSPSWHFASNRPLPSILTTWAYSGTSADPRPPPTLAILLEDELALVSLGIVLSPPTVLATLRVRTSPVCSLQHQTTPFLWPARVSSTRLHGLVAGRTFGILLSERCGIQRRGRGGHLRQGVRGVQDFVKRFRHADLGSLEGSLRRNRTPRVTWD